MSVIEKGVYLYQINKDMRTFKFQEMLYRAMTDTELEEVISNSSKYLHYYVEACITEKNRRDAVKRN